MSNLVSVLKQVEQFERIYYDNSFRFLREAEKRIAGIERSNVEWAESMELLSSALPKRGWYLTGEHPCTLFTKLAAFVKLGKWADLDALIMEHLPKFKVEVLSKWFRENEAPECTITRFARFLQNHDSGAFEESTFLGIPLLDEISNYLYKGKALTQKRSTDRKQTEQGKPELAIRSPGAPDINDFDRRFVETFGSLQENIDPNRLADEDYWNRHAIVHGKMRRSMGKKDSAKILMAIQFLIFAIKEEKAVEAKL